MRNNVALVGLMTFAADGVLAVYRRLPSAFSLVRIAVSTLACGDDGEAG